MPPISSRLVYAKTFSYHCPCSWLAVGCFKKYGWIWKQADRRRLCSCLESSSICLFRNPAIFFESIEYVLAYDEILTNCDGDRGYTISKESTLHLFLCLLVGMQVFFEPFHSSSVNLLPRVPVLPIPEVESSDIINDVK